MASSRSHDTQMNALVTTPKRRKRDADARKAQEARWAAKAGPVTSVKSWTRMSPASCFVADCTFPGDYSVRAVRGDYGAQLEACPDHLLEARQMVRAQVESRA